ncbi:universal stress protein [Telluribacter humicola]|uniref:universal stress protein n=1 Tax=Telluribacter humicola TaxID=1720261 RepID=UPI001A963E92|nr:universal stress protein [Telluribacter humicola]
MKKILAATDFSDNADVALTLAKRIALKNGATIYLTHVFRPMLLDNNLPSDLMLTLMDESEKLAFDQLVRLRREVEADGIKVEIDFRYGVATDGIMEAIQHVKPDLVVLGRTGQGRVLDKLLGSVASRIAIKSPCPVLVVPTTLDIPQIETIVYATQLEYIEHEALRFVFDLARHCNARVTLLKINSPEQLNIFKDEQFIIDIKQQFPDEAFTLKQVDANSVREGLNEYISKEKADLLVLANQKRDWLSNLLNPSLSKAMVLDSQTPLLVCHLDEDA